MATMPLSPDRPANRYTIRDILDRVSCRDIARVIRGEPAQSKGKGDFYHQKEGERTPSLWITDIGFTNFGTGGQRGGKLDYIQYELDCDRDQAKQWLVDHFGDNPLPPPLPKQSIRLERPDDPPDEIWQQRQKRLVHTGAQTLWSKRGREALDYLRGRGLSDDTIRTAGLGYDIRENCILIPEYEDSALVRVHRRFMSPNAPERYKCIGGSKITLYQGHLIQNGKPVILVFGEFDALIGQQVAGERATFVTLGGDSNHLPRRWREKLANVELFILCHDNDKSGEYIAGTKGAHLGLPEPTLVTSVPIAKDLNEFSTNGGNVWAWVTEVLATAAAVVDGSQNSAVDSHRANFITPKVTLGDMVRRLNEDPKQAVITLPKSNRRSKRSAYRDRANFINSNSISIQGNKIGTTAADSHFPAQWIRNVFPKGDKVTALVPIRLFTSELLAYRLTADEIDDLGDLPFMATLRDRDRDAVEQRIRLLKLIRRRVQELDRVPFVVEEGLTFDKVADLRPEVLRQIVAYYSTDQATGEITDCGLSNTIQACLIGTTIGALPAVRRRGGIEQIPQAVQEKAITSAASMPSNAYETFTRSGQLYAKVQPVSRQRVGDRPEPKPRAERKRKAQEPTQPVGEAHAESSLSQERMVAPPTPRRSGPEDYTAWLMSTLLYHADVEADENEPLDILTGKLRSLINPTDSVMEPKMQNIALTHPERDERELEIATPAEITDSPKDMSIADLVLRYTAVEFRPAERRAFLDNLTFEQRLELRKAVA
jgi:hypothetical protein